MTMIKVTVKVTSGTWMATDSTIKPGQASITPYIHGKQTFF